MLAAGTLLGPYEILAALGAGGMGQVYRARDTRLGRDVALKIIPSELAHDPDRVRRFEQEARAAGALSHPNVCAIFDVGSHGGAPFVVMELLEGEMLRDRLARGSAPVRKAVEWAAQAAHGLAAAHEKGIVHRDLKPENLFVTTDGRLKVLDFGLAKLTNPGLLPSPSTSGGAQAPTTTGVILGTVGYMSPEQAQGMPVDHRSDLFALGAILYEMLAGQRAFASAGPVETLYRICHDDPAPLSGSGRHVPARLAAIVRRCLEKEPAERFQSARDLAFDLEALLQTDADGEMTASRAASRPGRPKPLRWRRALGRAAWFAAGAALIAAIALLAGTRPGHSPDGARPVTAAIGPPAGAQFSSSKTNPLPIALSPDGSRIAFCAHVGEGPDLLWVRSLATGESKPLPGTESSFYPFFSPDGRSLGFFANGQLRRVDIDGAPATTLAKAADPRGGTWSRGGIILFVPEGEGPIFGIPAGGGQAAAATVLDSLRHETTHRFPHFLPDGRHFLYLARGAATAGAELAIFAGSLESRERVKVLDVASNVAYASGHLLFVRDGVLMAQEFDPKRLAVRGEPAPVARDVRWEERFRRGVFSASQEGGLAIMTGKAETRTQLRWIARDGSLSPPIGPPSDYTNGGTPALSPDGRRAAMAMVDQARGTSDLWILDLTTGGQRRMTVDSMDHTNCVWSADARTILMDANAKDWTSYLIAREAGGGGSEQILRRSKAWMRPYGWTPARDAVLYSEGYGLFVLPIGGGATGEPVPVSPDAVSPYSAQVSPDGRFISYDSNESGRREVYVVSFPQRAPAAGAGRGGKWQITQNGGWEARWARDGSRLYYFDLNNRLHEVDVRVSGAALESGEDRPLFQLRNVGGEWRYDVDREASRFLVLCPVEDSGAPSLITLVVNWPALLERE